MADLSLKTMEDLEPASLLLPPTPDSHRGSAASRPHPAARCSPAFRSSTSNRCSSCRCSTKNSFSRCCITGTIQTRTVVESLVGFLVHRGIQRDRDFQTPVLELSHSLNKETLLLNRYEDHLLISRITPSLLCLQSPSLCLRLRNPH